MNLSFWYSLVGHLLIGAIFFISAPDFSKIQTKLDSVPIFIDLKDIEISDKTNLPAKAKTVKKEVVSAPKKLPSKPKEVKKVAAAPSVKAPEVKPVQKTENIKDSAKMITPKEKKVEVKPKAKPVSVSKKTAKAPVSAKPKRKVDDSLDSLLASVEKMSAKPVKIAAKKDDSSEVSDLISGVLNGVQGGRTSALGTKLTVSQIDFIASTVRKHWNLDAGIDGIGDMVVEIRLSLGRNGRVHNVEFLNKDRYLQDTSFRSVAESAKRAIYICDKLGDESPFRMLAVKYPERYSDWQNIQLRFNPLDGGVS